MPCTPPNRGLLVTQLVGSCCVVFGSVCVCICMSMHQEHFKGHCALFSTGDWRERDGQLLVQWGSQVRQRVESGRFWGRVTCTATIHITVASNSY